MNPGEFDTKVQVQSPTPTRVNGERVQTYATIESPWCKFQRLSGREIEKAQQFAGEVDVKFTTWHSSTLSSLEPKSRVVHNSIQYDIQAAIPVPAGRPVHVEIWAKTRTTDLTV